MGGKYEIRYKIKNGWAEAYTNSFFEFIWLLITLKNKIYFRVQL